MTARLLGLTSVAPSMDKEGYRVYKVQFKVETDGTDMVVAATEAMVCPGLPVYGDIWPVDPWAYCRYDTACKQMSGYKDEKGIFWVVDKTYSSKPDQKKLCKDQRTDDPLLEPQKISGQFVKEKEEALRDRFGNQILTSSFEQINGPKNEWDKNHLSIKIEQNVPDLQLPLLSSMQNCLNQYPMWGLPKRCIKLGNSPWERKFYGNCYKYFTRTLEFDIRLEFDDETGQWISGWDRDITDEGTRVLKGRWEKVTGPSGNQVFTGKWALDKINGADPDKSNPAHFVRLKDFNDENTKMLLDGNGKPYVPEFLLKVPESLTAGLNIGGDLNVDDGYRYVVTAVNSAGETTPSQAASAKPQDTRTFPGGGLLQTVALVWKAVQGAASYKVYQSIGAADYKLLASGVAATATPSYVDDGSFTASGAAPPDTNDAVTPVYPKPGVRHVEKYQEADFFQLGIPTDL